MPSNIQHLSRFESSTADEILQIVSSFGVKCCPEDPIPAQLIIKNLNTFIPIRLELVNISLKEGSMDCLKRAVILPRLNKHMAENKLHSSYQYGYKKGDSAETLLLKIVNDLLIACDLQKIYCFSISVLLLVQSIKQNYQPFCGIDHYTVKKNQDKFS